MEKTITIQYNGKTFPVSYDTISSGNSSPGGNEKKEFYVSIHPNSELAKHCEGFRIVYLASTRSVTITGPTQTTFQGRQIQDNIITAIQRQEGIEPA